MSGLRKLSSAVGLRPSGQHPTVGPWLRFSPLLAVAILAVYAFGTDPAETGATSATTFAIGMLVIAAALIAGIAIGFLFGLPKTIEQAESKALLTTNSNLDKVSDWLTTILIGLGLVQLGEVAEGVDNLAATIAPNLGGGPGAETLAAGLLIYSAVDGVLVGYLWTRIALSFRFNEAARDLARAEQAQTTPPPSKPPTEPLPQPGLAPK